MEKGFGPDPEADRKGTPSGEPEASADGLLKITRAGHSGGPIGIGATERMLRSARRCTIARSNGKGPGKHPERAVLRQGSLGVFLVGSLC